MSPILGVVLVALSFSQLVNGHYHECQVDVCFVLDGSLSGSLSEWNNARTVIKTLVYMMDVGPDATQVGLVQFAGQAQVEFDLDDHDNKADVLSAINGLTHVNGSTKLSSGLDVVKTGCFGAGNGERPDVGRLVIILSDGNSTVSGDDPGAAATSLRNKDITILVVGVGNPGVATINIIANNLTANTFLVGTTYTYGSVVTALFDRFKNFCKHGNERTYHVTSHGWNDGVRIDFNPHIEISTGACPSNCESEKLKPCDKSKTPEQAIIKDCSDVVSGKYLINIADPGQDPSYQEVLCENRWMVLLKRQDGSVSFARTWTDYRDGFGELDGEFWAGNHLMYRVTNNGRNYRLRVDFETYSGDQYFAEYSSFSVGPPNDYYKLHVSGYDSSSSLGDSLAPHNGMRFSTTDQDHDNWFGDNCAQRLGQGGWWYHSCHNVQLTGLYGEYPAVATNKGIRWNNPLVDKTFAQRVSMKIYRI